MTFIIMERKKRAHETTGRNMALAGAAGGTGGGGHSPLTGGL